MNYFLLAKTTSHAAASAGDGSIHWPSQNEIMNWCQDMSVGTAILLLLAGIVYGMFGWKLFKALITLNAAVLGGYLGLMVGQRGGAPAVGAIVGTVMGAVLTYWLMKWAVAVIGGIIGAFVGAAVWTTAGQDPAFAWAGAMTGLVAFGMFSFILFRASIITYTSLQGAMMFVLGAVGLAYKYPEVGSKIATALSTNAYVLPVSIFIPAIVALIYQQTHSPGGEGAAGGGGGGGGGGSKK